MKPIRIELNGRTVILTCETSFLFGLIKKEVQFIATKEFPEGYLNWRKLPNRTSIDDQLRYQLDGWYSDFLIQKTNII